jgi:glycosyltransferase involved in cell wall biosynthesis
MKDIAVIIPLYNGEKWIRSTLESVFRQACVPSEIIVVDNNSTDSSVEIVQSFGNVKLINNPIPGPNFTRQCGFKASKAQFIAYLDQDDIWHPEHLNYLSNMLEQFAEYPAAVASYLSFSSSDYLRFPRPIFKTFPCNLWPAFPVNSIATPSSVMIRRTALESIGGWPTQFNFCGDIYTWLRLSVNHPFIQNKGITVGYRRQNKSQSFTTLLNNTQKSFTSLLSALEDACTYYSAVNDQKTSLLERRLLTLSEMAHIVDNMIVFESSKLSQSILRFEDCLSEESDGFVSSICGLLIWFLYSHFANQPKLLSCLLELWPSNAPRTRQAFREKIAGSRLLVKGLLSEPFNRQFLQLMVQHSNKIFKKIPFYHR